MIQINVCSLFLFSLSVRCSHAVLRAYVCECVYSCIRVCVCAFVCVVCGLIVASELASIN